MKKISCLRGTFSSSVKIRRLQMSLNLDMNGRDIYIYRISSKGQYEMLGCSGFGGQ